MEDKILDTSTQILLTPSYHGEHCLGNGENSEYECCCDECDHYLTCFPEWDTAAAIHKYLQDK